MGCIEKTVKGKEKQKGRKIIEIGGNRQREKGTDRQKRGRQTDRKTRDKKSDTR